MKDSTKGCVWLIAKLVFLIRKNFLSIVVIIGMLMVVFPPKKIDTYFKGELDNTRTEYLFFTQNGKATLSRLRVIQPGDLSVTSEIAYDRLAIQYILLAGIYILVSYKDQKKL